MDNLNFKAKNWNIKVKTTYKEISHQSRIHVRETTALKIKATHNESEKKQT